MYRTVLWVGSLVWAQLGGSAISGHTRLTFPGLVHGSVVHCQSFGDDWFEMI